MEKKNLTWMENFMTILHHFYLKWIIKLIQMHLVLNILEIWATKEGGVKAKVSDLNSIKGCL